MGAFVNIDLKQEEYEELRHFRTLVYELIGILGYYRPYNPSNKELIKFAQEVIEKERRMKCPIR